MTGFSEDPAAPYRARLDTASFFAWVQSQEGGRFELKDGEIVMHAGSTRRHSWLAQEFAFLLRSRLDREHWVIGVSDVAVEVGADIRYPDLIVERRVDDGRSLSTSAPHLIVEVLSPSSVARDMQVKLAEYTSLASLECYIVASQDEAIVWVWLRDPDTKAFPTFATELKGGAAVIEITSLGISLPLADLYRGIVRL